MATRTALELATNAMLHLGLVNSEETPSAVDSAYVINRYKDFLEELTDDNLAWWSYDAIPSVIFEPLTELIALIIATPFGKQLVAPSDMEAGLALYKRRIRRKAHVPSSDMPTHVENY